MKSLEKVDILSFSEDSQGSKAREFPCNYFVHVSEDRPVEFKLLCQKVAWSRVSWQRSFILDNVILDALCVTGIC